MLMCISTYFVFVNKKQTKTNLSSGRRLDLEDIFLVPLMIDSACACGSSFFLPKDTFLFFCFCTY